MSRGVTLVSLVFARRLLQTTGFGEVGMIQSAQDLFAIVAGVDLGLAATKFIAESLRPIPQEQGAASPWRPPSP